MSKKTTKGKVRSFKVWVYRNWRGDIANVFALRKPRDISEVNLIRATLTLDASKP